MCGAVVAALVKAMVIAQVWHGVLVWLGEGYNVQQFSFFFDITMYMYSTCVEKVFFVVYRVLTCVSVCVSL